MIRPSPNVNKICWGPSVSQPTEIENSGFLEFSFHQIIMGDLSTTISEDETFSGTMVFLWTRRAAVVLGPNVSTRRRIVPLSSFSFRFLTIPTSSAAHGGAGTTTPLQAIQNATAALNHLSSRLQVLATTLQTPLTLLRVENHNQQEHSQQQQVVVTLRDIVLHSRDCPLEHFHDAMAQTARTTVLPIAEAIEHDLIEMSHYYTQSVLPQMTLAVQICQETPCGGASWEMDLEAAAASAALIRVQGQDTPCGALHAANLSFLETTYDTKETVLLASRAALILRLALEFNEPLSTVRQRSSTDPKKKNRMREVFASQVVSTPWIRTKEEYEHFFKFKEELLLKEGKGQE
jgi:hypothetical protein